MNTPLLKSTRKNRFLYERTQKKASEPEKKQSKLDSFKNILSVAQSIGTLLALLAGAIWFYEQRQHSFRATVKHDIENHALTDEWNWVRLRATLTNTGNVPMVIGETKAYVQKIIPLDSDIKTMIEANKNIVESESHLIPWHTIGQPYSDNSKRFIAPSESENFEFDFVIPANICLIGTTTFFENVSSENKNFGWRTSTVYPLKTRGCI